MKKMDSKKKQLIANLYNVVGFENEDFNQLVELLAQEEEQLSSYKESAFDVVNTYHNEVKDLKTIVEELVTVLSATREYELDRLSFSEKQEQLLWDTGSDSIIKALKALN